MNLAIKSSIDGMFRQANVLAGRVGSLVDESQAAAEAKDALLNVCLVGDSLMRFYGDLEHVQKSIEGNGFSQEWLDAINADNRFLDAINVDLVNLVGTDADKAEVCTEGILGAIWDVIKRIWNWIVDAIGKLCTYLKRILMVFRIKGSEMDKLKHLIMAIRGRENFQEIIQAIGEELNSGGGRGGKAYDLRQIIERASVFRVIAAFFNNGIEDILGLQTVDKKYVMDSQLVSPAIMKMARDGSDPENLIMIKFKEFLSRDQNQISAFSNMTTSGFKGGFEVMKNPRGFRDMMKEVGVGFSDGSGAGALSIKPIQDVIEDIDYTKVYIDVDQYNKVFCDAFHREEGLCTAISQQIETANTFLRYICDCIHVVLDDLRAYATSKGNAKTTHITIPVDPAIGRALQMQSKFVADTISLMTKSVTEMVNTLNEGSRLRDICIREFEKRTK